MIAIALFVVIAVLLSWKPLRRALPFDSLLAAGLSGLVMVALLAAGRAG